MKTLKAVSILLFAAQLVLGGPKLAKDLPPASSNAAVKVIIQFNGVPTDTQLRSLAGGTAAILRRFDRIKAACVRVPAHKLPDLEADPFVLYVSPDRSNRGLLDYTAAAVSAGTAWQLGFDGTGIGVAVIDSGVTPDPDFTDTTGLGSRVVYAESFVTGKGAADEYGHGTHVAGIVGSSGRNSSGAGFTRTFRGLAPNVNLINLRVLDQNGSGQESDVLAAIQRAIDLKNTYNIRVINLSLGRPVFESYTLDPLCRAVEAAWKAGIVVVTAAGNNGRNNSQGTKGYGTIVSPGNDPYVITVGAMKTNGTYSPSDDTIASYSSKGPTAIDHFVKPDLVAPGNRIISVESPNCTLATLYPKTVINTAAYETFSSGSASGDYMRLSGTSMATPVVSGAAALLIQKQPTLTPDQVKARLMKTATKAVILYSSTIDAYTNISYSSQSDIFTVGAGYLNIAAALANNDLVTMPALSPVASYNSITRKASILRDLSVVWGDSVLWGDSIIWGDAVVFGGTLSLSGPQILASSVLWGDSIVWGDSTLAGFSVLWGDSTTTASSLTATSSAEGLSLDLDGEE